MDSQWHYGSAMDEEREEGEEGEEDEEDDGSGTPFPSGRDCVIFLIDCTAGMHEPFDEQGTFVDRCLKAAHTTLLEKIVSSDKDLVGIVLYGTEKKQNPGNFNHVFVLQDLSMPDAKRIKELEDLLAPGADMRTHFGVSDTFSLSDALWTCSNLFSNAREKTLSKRVMIFTNNDSPHADNAVAQRQAVTKAGDLRDVNIDIDLLHMCEPRQVFDLSRFYKDVISVDPGGDSVLPQSATGFDTLLTRVRTKVHKKRALMKIPFTICPGLEIGVSFYSLVAEAKKGGYVWLDKASNREVSTRTRYFCRQTGQLLLPSSVKAYMPYGGEKVIFDKEEVTQIKKFDSPGLVLMGFKPRDRLKPHYHVKNSSFIHPDESVISGSSQVFLALLDRMLANNCVAICRLIARISGEPRFVALLPQKEEVDESGSQVMPSGFHVIHLPYADDMRKLDYKRDLPRASDEQKAKMAKLITKMDFPSFSSDNFENPTLQKHYRNLEALALDRDEPEPFEDLTDPDPEQLKASLGKYTAAVREAIFPEGYDPEAAAAPKRTPAAPRAPAGKRAKKGAEEEAEGGQAESVLTLDDVKRQFQAGLLGKYTVPVLKEACRLAKLKPAARKPDLLEQLEAYFSSA